MNRIEDKDIVKEKNEKKEINEKNKEVKITDNTNYQENINNVKSKNISFRAKQIIRKIIQTVLQTRLFVVLTAIALLLKTILLYKVAIFTTKPLEFKFIYMAFAFICIFLTIPMILKNKSRFWTTIAINFIVSLLLFTNELYYTYATNLVSVSQISNLQYGREISVALPSLLHFRQLLYIIDIIILLALYYTKKVTFVKTNSKDSEENFIHKQNKKKRVYYAIPGVIYLVCMIILSAFINQNWIAEAETHQYNKIQQIETSSIFGYHYIDIKNNLNMKKNVKYKTKSSMLEEYEKLMDKYDSNYNLQYDFTGIAKDKNVIIVQLESVQNFVVNRTINGKEITPNLNKFLNENIEFTNMQNQSYSSTADSEYAVMNSLYPLENGMSFAQYPSNDYNDIYQDFKKENYITTYIHGNEGSFWNRQSVYSRLKIDNLLFDNIFDENVERINNYVSDEQVYRKIVDEVKDYNDKFLVNIVAASSHIAFDLPGIENKESKVNIDVGEEYKDMFFGNYLEAVNYADYAFGILIDELKNIGLYDDTVILVYGDHAGLQMYNWEMQDFIKECKPLNDIQTQINYSNVLCGLKIPGVESMKIDKPVSKLDIKPTLTQICGIEDEFSLGTSMFSNKDFVCLNNGRIITDKYFYDGDWYSIDSGELLDLDNMPEEEVCKLNDYCDSLQKELDISLSINILNLLK